MCYLSVCKFDIVCLSGTYFNSSFPFDDDNLEMPGYVMVRVDHPANSKRGELFSIILTKIYYTHTDWQYNENKND